MTQPNEERLLPQIVMRRDSLQDLPPLEPPDGCEIRTYIRGCEAAWEKIIVESFKLRAEDITFASRILSDEEFRPDRVLFIYRDGEPVATASAWYRGKWGEQVGYLHYVGVLPSEGGRGLGRQISLACLHKMAQEGRSVSILETDDFRIPAIKTYLSLGFRPLLIHENQLRRWETIYARIGREELVGELEGRWADGVMVR